ncbi:unconventional myosin-XVIIIa-like isoform X2 [Tachypleus tridentatus]|uniref:unconventional myosin-XVIIIa-like isoform X2 n=1 Tax=Tachypleus tridentatus TaxID=6853 RepID=UPI003FD3FC71
MFRWIKDKDKDDKRGKERKEKKEKKEKKHGKQREKLTYDELKRTNEITKNYLSSYQKSPNSAGGEDENSEKRSTGSEYSLSSSAKSGDSSPMEGHGVGFLSRKGSSPVKHPPPVPKKPLGLHVKSSYSSMQCTSPVKSPSITSNLSSPQGSLANEMMALMDQMGSTKSSKSSVLHLEPTPSVLVEDERRTLFTAPPGEQAGLDVVWKSYDDDLELPSIAPPKPPRARSLTIQRQPAGDFGFSLRRAPVGEHRGLPPTDKKQTIIFAEPSNLERGNETGLLPGDRLLEVNGVVIENKSREEIIELIKTSGDSVTLKVQPVPELSELSVQCGFDGSEVGSPRIRSQTKSAEQLAVDRAWLQTNQVWLVHKGGFAGSHLLTAEESPSLPPSEGKLWVRLDAQGSVLEVDQEDVEKANPSHLDRVEDLSELRHLNESSILHILRQRYASSLIHTYAANTLLVINPQHPMALYSEKIMKMFRGSKQTDMPPHIYSVGRTAYSALLTSRRDQSVVFLGRSGSGKTTNVRQVLQYLVVTAGCLNNVISVEKLTAISTLLEAFGNCRTVLNSNATRFTQLFSLDFDHSGQIVSASVQAYMVERTRVSRRAEGEPNFNVFYQMLEGIDDALRKELHLENVEEPNIFMSPLQKVEDKHRAGLSWAFLCAALQTLTIQDAEAKAIWSILAAIYHLGAAGVSCALSNKAQFARPQSAQKAASLLGTSVEDLAKVIFSIDFLGSAKNSPRSGNVDVMNDALESLQALVAGLYSEVFHALLTLINRSLAGSSSRRMASIQVLDAPGFQNPASCNKYSGSQLQDLLYNYCQERLQLLFHKATFQAQEDRYTQENISWDSDHYLNITPEPMVSLIDQVPPQQGPSRSSNINLREEQRGLLWLLDEESMFPNSSEQNFIERIFAHSNTKEKRHLLQKGPHLHLFTLQHLQGTNPVTYNTAGWLKACREHPVVRQASPLLQDSQRDYISQLYVSSRGPSSTMTGTIGSSDSATLRRTSSIRRTQTVATAGVKRRSLPLQVKYTMDALIDILNRSQLHFVHCLLPQHNAGHWNHRSKILKRSSGCEDFLLNVPLLRSQLRGAQIIDSVRVYKQGFPEHLMYGEFRRRVELLAPPEQQPGRQISDDKQAVEQLIENLDFDKSSYRIGLSQIFLRAGTLARLENQRDEKLHDMIVRFQTHCRGYLARSKLNKYKVQDMAIRCIQRNVRKFLEVKSWPWWRLFVKLTPLLNVHRTEEELRLKTEELETLKAKTLRLEKERNELKQTNEKLEMKVSELWADLNEEHSAATHASEMLETETSERMKLEKEIQDMQTRCSAVQQRNDQMEMEMMESRMYRSTELNGELSDEDGTGSGSIYKQKYEHMKRELELTKRRLQQQHEEELETHMLGKKAVDKKLAEALEEAEEERRVANQWKRKAQKLGQEMQDLRLLMEDHMNRNADLEKKQRKFDLDLSAAQDQVRQERFQREQLQKERDKILYEKSLLEEELKSVKMDMDFQTEKIHQLNSELEELTYNSHEEKELMQLKRTKQEMERKVKDQEEELEDFAGQVQLLEQGKLRLEMAMEKLRQETRKELSAKEEEVEEIRISAAKKVKNLEAQLENEQEDRHQLMKQKHELERKIIDMSERPPEKDPELERRLRRDLRRTKALLRDAQDMMEHAQDGQGNKLIIRQLKNQLEDAEFAKAAAIKARQGIELELQNVQNQLEEITKTKNEAESRCLQLSREKSALRTQFEEIEEEQGEVLKKYKSAVQQMTNDQKLLSDQTFQITDLEEERQMLKEQIGELTSRLEHISSKSEDPMAVKRVEAKMRELESRLDFEQINRSRLEKQLERLKEQCDRLREENETLKTKEHHAQEGEKRLQRQIRELREDYTNLQQKECEAHQKCRELELSLENTEADLQSTKNDLRLACQRIHDLQCALEEDLDTSTDVPDDSGSDSENSSDMEPSHHQFSSGRQQYSMGENPLFSMTHLSPLSSRMMVK